MTNKILNKTINYRKESSFTSEKEQKYIFVITRQQVLYFYLQINKDTKYFRL